MANRTLVLDDLKERTFEEVLREVVVTRQMDIISS
jgi:hypothetical protein